MLLVGELGIDVEVAVEVEVVVTDGESLSVGASDGVDKTAEVEAELLSFTSVKLGEADLLSGD